MTISELQNIYNGHLGRAATAEDIKYWGGASGLAKKKKGYVEASVADSPEALRRKNPENFELANRDDYAHNAKALKMYDLSISIKGKAPTKGELNNWVRYGSLEEWESSLRDEIKWKSKRRADGRTTTVKYYSKEALDRLGGNIGKGTNAGEVIATPTSYGQVVGRKDRWSSGIDSEDGWTYRAAQGSYKKGLVGKVLGEKVERKASGTGIFIMDPTSEMMWLGESGAKHHMDRFKFLFGSEGRAEQANEIASYVEDAVAVVIDIIAFDGAPVVSTARRASKSYASEVMTGHSGFPGVGRDIAIDWATYGARKGLDKFAAASKWGSTWTDYGRPASKVAIGTAAGVARGQEFKDAFASSVVNTAAEEIVPKGTSPWVAQAIKTGIPAAYQYSQAKGNDSAQMSAVASAIINYGAGVWQSSGQQKTGELVTSPAAVRSARKVTADEANKKLAAPPQASNKVRDVSDYFLAGGSTEERSRKLALYA